MVFKCIKEFNANECDENLFPDGGYTGVSVGTLWVMHHLTETEITLFSVQTPRKYIYMSREEFDNNFIER